MALDITGVKDGMHLIDTVIVPIGLADILKVSVSDEFSVSYKYGRVYRDDTALKAAKLISEAFGTPPVKAVITKRIPEGKGLGGSSADAAGLARAMGELFEFGTIPRDILIKIGSDVPAMYANRPVRVRGAGEDVVPIDIGKLYIITAEADYCIGTREAYARYDKIGGDKADIEGFLAGRSPAVNALERAAVALEPRIEGLKTLLKASGLPEVVMTGSGSGFVGFTRQRAEYEYAKEYLESHIGGGITVRGYQTT